MAEEEGDERLAERADRWLDRGRSVYESHGRVFRVLWVAAGVVIVLAGIAMIVVPGPVTIVVPLGLAMLGVAFGWARRLLVASVEKGEQAKERAEAASTATKVLGFAASALVAAAAVVLLFVLWL
jgi:uncharacterized protein (TIGR02611 family)